MLKPDPDRPGFTIGKADKPEPNTVAAKKAAEKINASKAEVPPEPVMPPNETVKEHVVEKAEVNPAKEDKVKATRKRNKS